jgi:hypothetical protein
MKFSGETTLGGMRTRIPPAVYWLLERRSRLIGQIEALEKRREELKRDLATLKRVQKDLKSLEQVIKMHELATECGPGAPIRFKKYKKTLPYGRMTEFGLEYLQMSEGEGRTTTEVAIYIAARGGIEVPESEFVTFRELVRYQMKNQRAKGRVCSKSEGGHPAEILWFSPPAKAK